MSAKHQVPESQATLDATEAVAQTQSALAQAQAKRARIQALDERDADDIEAENKRIAAAERDPARAEAKDAYARGEGPRPAKIDTSRRDDLLEDRGTRAAALDRVKAEIAALEADLASKCDAMLSACAADYVAVLGPKLAEVRALAERVGCIALFSRGAGAQLVACGLGFRGRDALGAHFASVTFPPLRECMPAGLPASALAALKNLRTLD